MAFTPPPTGASLPPPPRAAFRTHAKRSCLTCRKRKTRCELPDPEIQASPTPLPAAFSCHRCKTLRLECVVADAPRGVAKTSKRKRNEEEPGSPASSSGLGKRASEETSNPNPSCGNPPSSLIHLFNPEGTGQVSQTTNQYENGIMNDVETEERKHELVIHPYPLALLNALSARVQNFGRDLSTGDTTYSMQRIVSSFSGRFGDMQAKLKFMLLFIPHLPAITTLREELESRPSTATRLLLSTVLLLTMPDDDLPDRLNLEASLRRFIQQDLFAVLMMETRGVRSIQALELIAVYSPLTVLPGFGTQPVSGSSCLAAAKSSAISMGLHKSLDQLKQLQAASLIAGMGGRGEGSAMREEEKSEIQASCRSLAEKAIIWSSLKVWDAHFRTFEFGHTSSVKSYSSGTLDAELESSMVLAFTNHPEDVEEASARYSGCAAIKHRMRVLETAAAGKPEINRVGEDYSQGPLRANELSKILDKNYAILEHHRQSREREFAVLAHSDFYLRCLVNWTELEAMGAESVLSCVALSMLLKEAFAYIKDGASSFFERTHALGFSDFMLKYGGKNRIDETDAALAIFMTLPASPFSNAHAVGAPPRSTCALVILAAVHIMESCASSIAGFKRPHPRLASMLSRLEGLAEKLKQMEPSGSIELGSVPQTCSSIVYSIITHINAWQRKLLETSTQQGPSANHLPWLGNGTGEQNTGHSFSTPTSVSNHSNHSYQSLGPINHPTSSSNGTSVHSSNSHEPFFPSLTPQESQAYSSFPPVASRPEGTITDAEIDSILSGGMMFWPADLDLQLSL